MRTLLRSAPSGLVVIALALAAAPRLDALPLYAARTGLMCQSCHFDPNGGGPRNEFGFAFARGRHSLAPDTTSAWKDLAIGNRVAPDVPVYFGTNQRFMLLSNANATENQAERAAFFSMENALHVTFQPHPHLTLVYTRDAYNDVPAGEPEFAQDAFGMISGLPWSGYVKAGRFRTPFGLRMDDHTVATRAGYLNLVGSPSFLPYDPRFPDMGVEIGGERGSVFARAALTNGAANVFGSQPFAQTTTAKLGVNHAAGQLAVSLHDDYEKGAVGPIVARRATRWGAYLLTHRGPVQLIAEAGAGTDQHVPRTRTQVVRPHVNLLAAFTEADWTPNRVVNFRVRWDRLVTDRDGTRFTRGDGTTVSTAELASSTRWGLEGEILPVPFAELRWALRVIVPDADRGLDGLALRRERQGYLQFHFSY